MIGNILILILGLSFYCNFVSSKGIEDIPYYASIMKNGRHVCSGAIISEKVILTTASCLFNTDNLDITVRLGSDQFESDGVVKPVQKLILHKRYMTSRKDYDIALIILEDKLVFSETIQAIDMVNGGMFAPKQGEHGVLIGFGLGEELYTDDLREEDVEISVPINCKNAYAPLFIYITERMFCSELKVKHSCRGDSGSLLIINNQLVGIQAWEHKCGTSKFPGIYTNIANLRKWIKNEVAF